MQFDFYTTSKLISVYSDKRTWMHQFLDKPSSSITILESIGLLVNKFAELCILNVIPISVFNLSATKNFLIFKPSDKETPTVVDQWLNY